MDLKRVLSAEQKRIGFEQCTDPALFHRDYPVKGMPRLTVPVRHPDDAWMAWPDCCGECLYAPWEVGERLWVRETWQPFHDDELWTCVRYRADDARIKPTLWSNEEGAWCEHQADGDAGPWRPSIHMPRWASRLTLEITDVRVERLQEISPGDAQREGIEGYAKLHNLGGYWTTAFARLWDELNAKRGYSWDANPWIWAISFKRLEPSHA